LKGLTFVGCTVGIKISFTFEAIAQGCYFENCGTGIENGNGNAGFFALIDSSAKNVGVLFNTKATTDGQGSVVLENVLVDESVYSVSITQRSEREDVLMANCADCLGQR
jgi:glucan 1,3-beta-glucosidase